MRALGDLDEGEPPFEPGDLALDLPPAISAAAPALRAGAAGRGPRTTRSAAASTPPARSSWPTRWPASSTASRSRRPRRWPADRRPRRRGDLAAPLAGLGRLPEAGAGRLAARGWPTLGLIDVGARRVRAAARARPSAGRDDAARPGAWSPPARPAAAPAVADLLAVIAGLPQGAVVLPGLDLEPRRERLGARSGEQHPQGGDEAAAGPRRRRPRRRARPGAAERDDRARPLAPAADQRGAAPGRGHRRLAGADQAPARRGRGATASTRSPRAWTASRCVYARAEEEAATAAALLLREALETPGRTAALVTPDAGPGPPGQRAADALGRGGRFLGRRAAGRLSDRRPDRPGRPRRARSARPGDPAGASPSTASCASASTTAGPGALARRAWSGRCAARGAPTGTAHRGAETKSEAALGRLLDDAAARPRERLAAPFAGGAARAGRGRARRWPRRMEALARGRTRRRRRSAVSGAGWPARRAAALIAGADRGERRPAGRRRRAGFADLVERLLARETVRGGGATHPRLRILGAIEARLVARRPADPGRAGGRRLAAGRAGRPLPVAADAQRARPAAAGAPHRPCRPRLRPGAPAPPEVVLLALRAARGRAGGGVALALAAGDPGRAAPGLAAADPAGAAGPRAPSTRRSASRRPRRPGADAAGRRAAARAAGHRRRALDPRPLRRLRPLHPAPAAAGPARRAGGGAGPRHGGPQPRSSASPASIPARCADGAEAAFAAILIECLADGRRADAAGWRASGRWRSTSRPGWSAFERRRRPGARLLIEQTGDAWPSTRRGGRFTVTAKADRIELRGRVGRRARLQDRPGADRQAGGRAASRRS